MRCSQLVGLRAARRTAASASSVARNCRSLGRVGRIEDEVEPASAPPRSAGSATAGRRSAAARGRTAPSCRASRRRVSVKSTSSTGYLSTFAGSPLSTRLVGVVARLEMGRRESSWRSPPEKPSSPCRFSSLYERADVGVVEGLERVALARSETGTSRPAAKMRHRRCSRRREQCALRRRQRSSARPEASADVSAAAGRIRPAGAAAAPAPYRLAAGHRRASVAAVGRLADWSGPRQLRARSGRASIGGLVLGADRPDRADLVGVARSNDSVSRSSRTARRARGPGQIQSRDVDLGGDDEVGLLVVLVEERPLAGERSRPGVGTVSGRAGRRTQRDASPELACGSLSGADALLAEHHRSTTVPVGWKMPVDPRVRRLWHLAVAARERGTACTIARDTCASAPYAGAGATVDSRVGIVVLVPDPQSPRRRSTRGTCSALAPRSGRFVVRLPVRPDRLR